jgi:hypothetical protein
VYRELHGVLGEGKDRFQFGLAVALYLLNTLSRESILKRLKVQCDSSQCKSLLALMKTYPHLHVDVLSSRSQR